MIAECGGKDALLVGPDADLDAAADAAAWGAVSNAGQTCIGVERVYVVDEVYHSFVEKLSERMAAARAGDDREATYGPMTMPGQLDVVEDHIADALARGGRAVLGGMQSIRRPYVDPVMLADVPEQSMAVQDETFGPTITVTRVNDLSEAVELANASRFALGSAVFAGNAKKAMAAARALRSGMTSINSVIAYATVPVAAVRRGRRLRFRPHPRRGRAAGVHPGQVDHPAADEAAAEPDHAGAQRQGHEPAAVAHHPAARQALQQK